MSQLEKYWQICAQWKIVFTEGWNENLMLIKYIAKELWLLCTYAIDESSSTVWPNLMKMAWSLNENNSSCTYWEVLSHRYVLEMIANKPQAESYKVHPLMTNITYHADKDLRILYIPLWSIMNVTSIMSMHGQYKWLQYISKLNRFCYLKQNITILLWST